MAAYTGDVIEGFICFPPADQGLSGDSCTCANCCAEGHLCTDSATYGPDCNYTLCCTEYCNITDTNFVCTGAGQLCTALFDANNPLYFNIGACLVP